MTSYRLNKRFWAMLEPTSIWPNFTFGQLSTWIGSYNDHIWLPMGLTSDSEQCLNRLQLDLILLLVNFWYELGKIMTRYDFLDARFVIWLAIDLLLLLVNIWFWAKKNNQIWLPEASRMIFSNIRTNFNFWSIFCGQKVNFNWRSYQASRVELLHNRSLSRQLSKMF